MPESVIRVGKAGRAKLSRPGKRFWSDAAEERFLDTLALTANVTAAAEAAGFSGVTVYRRRRKWPGFAERWDRALEEGYGRVEALLIQNASDTLAGNAPDPAGPMPPMTVSDALNLLRLHHAQVKQGRARATGQPLSPRDLDDVRAGIVRKLEAIERMSEPA